MVSKLSQYLSSSILGAVDSVKTALVLLQLCFIWEVKMESSQYTVQSMYSPVNVLPTACIQALQIQEQHPLVNPSYPTATRFAPHLTSATY